MAGYLPASDQPEITLKKPLLLKGTQIELPPLILKGNSGRKWQADIWVKTKRKTSPITPEKHLKSRGKYLIAPNLNSALS